MVASYQCDKTVRVNVWVVVPAELVAVMVKEWVPAVPEAGVPDRTPLAVLKLTPLGSFPDSVNVGAG